MSQESDHSLNVLVCEGRQLETKQVPFEALLLESLRQVAKLQVATPWSHAIYQRIASASKIASCDGIDLLS